MDGDKIREEARAQDKKRWVVYDRSEDGSVNTWLNKWKPSVIKRSDGVGWISARKEHDSIAESTDGDNENCVETEINKQRKKSCLIKGINEWKKLGKHATLEDVFHLASKYHITTGKWMIFAKRHSVDIIWKSIVMAMIDGKLKHVVSAKVSAFDDYSDAINRSHVICVYNNNFLDKTEVFEAERSLRKVYPGGRLTYKPNIFTYFGIYKKNQWKIKPSIYESKGLRSMHDQKRNNSGAQLSNQPHGYSRRETKEYCTNKKHVRNSHRVITTKIKVINTNGEGNSSEIKR